MSRESTYHGIILKLQPLGEADEIVTFYTLESGKIRALAKSVKLSTSKLRASLQAMFAVEVTLAGKGKLPKIIRCTAVETYQIIMADAERLSRWFVAAELIIRATADEQKNPELFILLRDFLQFMNRPGLGIPALEAALIKFKISVLIAIGLGVLYPDDLESRPAYFSNMRGGFITTRLSNDAVAIDSAVWEWFQKIRIMTSFGQIADFAEETAELQHILTSFIQYQLEREIKSERYIAPNHL